MRIPPETSTTQTGRKRRPIPKPQGLKLLRQVAEGLAPQSLPTEPSLDAPCGVAPLLLQGFQGSGQMALSLGLDRRRVDHGPDLTLAPMLAAQHAEQLAYVAPIALGPTLAPADLNGRGVHPMMGEPRRQQKPMEPKPFAPGCVATDHGGRFWQAKTAFSLGDCVEHALLMPRGPATLTGLLTRPCRKAELPVFFTQFKGHAQRRLGWVLLPIVCRWRCHELSPL